MSAWPIELPKRRALGVLNGVGNDPTRDLSETVRALGCAGLAGMRV